MGPNASRLDMRFAMAETPKLSVEKALEKLRAADALKSKDARRTEEMDEAGSFVASLSGRRHVRRTRRRRRAGRLRFDAVRRNVRFAPIRISPRSMPTTSAKVWTRANSRLG